MTNGADGPSTRVSRLSFTEVWAPAAEDSRVEAAARRSAARSNLCHCGANLTLFPFCRAQSHRPLHVCDSSSPVWQSAKSMPPESATRNGAEWQFGCGKLAHQVEFPTTEN